MNGQCQIPTGSNARVSGNPTGSCKCAAKSRSSNAGNFENAKSSFPSSELSNKSTTPYDDWSVLDDEEQNTFIAFRKRACDFIASEPEEVQVKTLPHRCACGREPLYACPTLLKKATDMIDYVPQSEFLKKVKQQCQLLEYNEPNIFSAINDGVVNDSFDVEGFIEQSSKRLREPYGCMRQCRAAEVGAFRQNNVQHNLNETYNVQCNMDETYTVEPNQALASSGENIIQSKNAQERKSEHVSRSKKPHKCRGRRKRKSGSGEADECTAGDVFVPTLKRPHENSCERCWRYASPSRSPVNKPEQRYDPNFRRGHSCHNFERGDADLDVSDRDKTPCRNLQAVPSGERTFTLPPRTSSPSFSEEIPPSNFQNLKGSPLPKSNKQGVSLWQKPSTAPAGSERVLLRTPSPYPNIQQRTTEMYQSPHSPVQQEYSANQASSQSVRQQKTQVQFKSSPSPIEISFYDSPDSSPERTVLSSPVYDSPVDPNYGIIYSKQRQSRPRGSRITPEKLTDIPAVERHSEGFQSPNATQYKNLAIQQDYQGFGVCPPDSVPPVLASQVCPPRQGAGVCSRESAPPVLGSQVCPPRQSFGVCSRESAPPVLGSQVCPPRQSFGVCSHESAPPVLGSQVCPPRQSFGVCSSESAPPVLGSQVCSPRQVSLAKVGPTGLTTIPEAADSDSNKTKSPKEQRSSSPKYKQVKSPKNASRQSVGSHRGSSGSHRGSTGSNRGSSRSNVGSSPVKAHSPNKSGSPKKGKPKTPSPRPSTDRSPNMGERSPEKSPSKQKSPEVVESAQPRSPEKRPQSPGPQHSPVKSPVQEAAGAPAVQHQYEVPDHLFVRCHCRSSPITSPDEDYNPGHLVCCHCKWQERAKDGQSPRSSRNGAGRMSSEKNLEQNPRGYDGVAFRCPYLRNSKGEEIGVTPERFGEAELRVMRQYRGEPSFGDISAISCSPKKYVVMYMTKCKENKADEDVEVLVEELTQACPKTTDPKTEDITEKMKKIMECPTDSMALRFQKGVSESYKVPQSSRILYF